MCNNLRWQCSPFRLQLLGTQEKAGINTVRKPWVWIPNLIQLCGSPGENRPFPTLPKPWTSVQDSGNFIDSQRGQFWKLHHCKVTFHTLFDLCQEDSSFADLPFITCWTMTHMRYVYFMSKMIRVFHKLSVLNQDFNMQYTNRAFKYL